jgi:acetyl esterase/lipase
MIDVMLGMVIASTFNCALLIPDYIGYGESINTTHPYTHAQSLGQTGLDFIRAYRQFMADSTDLAPNNDIFITGYSEGGFASVSLHKAIDALPATEGIKVFKTVAGAGAYDLEGFSKAILNNKSATGLGTRMLSSYLWVIGMYKNDFQYSKDYAEIFSAEDNLLLSGINYNLAYYSNEKADGTPYLALHEIPSELFQPAFISGILEGTDTEFIRISKENDLLDVVPQDSLIFVHGTADNWVYPANSETAYNTMRAKGCPVKYIEVPGKDHTTALPKYVEEVLNRLMLCAAKGK